MNKKIPVFISSLLLSFNLLAQSSFSGKEIDSEYNRGLDLFNKEKYPAAIRLFDSYIRNSDGKDRIMLADAEFYAALSAIRVFNPDAEYRMTVYMKNHPESPRITEATVSLADFFYQNKNYRKAATYYEDVNRQELASDKLPEYYFRYGYSLYVRGDKEKAQVMFSEIKDIDTEYTPPALYYFSQIAYEQNMYETAMGGFLRLKDDETFGPIVPFYIIQILYLQKDYNAILEMGPGLLESAPNDRAVELYRFIGDAYYNNKDYKTALSYLEKYAASAKESAREDKYQLGYCYYMTGDFDNAIKILLETGARSDLLSQNIWYVLGDCYLQKDDKKRAQLAFGQASKMDFDPKIKEEALFNYAKLTYETSYSPFGEAISAFQEYINLYPGSDKIDEAYNYLVSSLLEIKNYNAALSALDKIRNKDSRLEEAYQRVTFFRGLELLNNMEIAASVDMFDKSLQFGKYNREIRARAVYWRGEARYRLGRFAEARDDYELFQKIPGSSSLRENDLLKYNLGYALFNMNDYQGALNNFRTFEVTAAAVKPELLSDTKLRIADCYYITTNYPQAISYYDKVIEYGQAEADYAMYQKGFCMGLSNNQQGKVDVLSSLIAKFPSSSYVPDALFERGRAFLVLGNSMRGEADFINVIANYNTSSFVPKAIVQLGLLYYNQGDNRKSIEQFKKVIENYNSTPEARYALTGLKNAYVEMNDVEGYFAYVRTIGQGDVSLSERDSLLYISGENLYIEGNCIKASDVFRNYLGEFRNGVFRLNAQFYLAECLNSSGKPDEALAYYEEVIKVPNNQFMEQALISASAIEFNNENYTSATDYYEKLEKIAFSSRVKIVALRGLLRSAYQSGDATRTISASERIGNTRDIPDELRREATFMKGKAHYSLNEYDTALEEFRKVANEVSSAEGAESKYRVAELLYRKGDIAESERVVTQFIDQNSPHQFWMAKIFLLLSDISISKGDLLQARATLQSLKEYYTIKDDGIIDEVNAKLSSLDREA